MQIKTGVDLIYLPKFKRALKNGGENFLQRVFVSNELKNTNIEHLAGIFAAKEAVMKALEMPTDSWHDIMVVHKSNGAPEVRLLTSHISLLTSSLSVSHTGQYVIAQFVALLN